MKLYIKGVEQGALSILPPEATLILVDGKNGRVWRARDRTPLIPDTKVMTYVENGMLPGLALAQAFPSNGLGEQLNLYIAVRVGLAERYTLPVPAGRHGICLGLIGAVGCLPPDYVAKPDERVLELTGASTWSEIFEALHIGGLAYEDGTGLRQSPQTWLSGHGPLTLYRSVTNPTTQAERATAAHDFVKALAQLHKVGLPVTVANHFSIGSVHKRFSVNLDLSLLYEAAGRERGVVDFALQNLPGDDERTFPGANTPYPTSLAQMFLAPHPALPQLNEQKLIMDDVPAMTAAQRDQVVARSMKEPEGFKIIGDELLVPVLAALAADPYVRHRQAGNDMTVNIFFAVEDDVTTMTQLDAIQTRMQTAIKTHIQAHDFILDTSRPGTVEPYRRQHNGADERGWVLHVPICETLT